MKKLNYLIFVNHKAVDDFNDWIKGTIVYPWSLSRIRETRRGVIYKYTPDEDWPAEVILGDLQDIIACGGKVIGLSL